MGTRPGQVAASGREGSCGACCVCQLQKHHAQGMQTCKRSLHQKPAPGRPPWSSFYARSPIWQPKEGHIFQVQLALAPQPQRKRGELIQSAPTLWNPDTASHPRARSGVLLCASLRGCTKCHRMGQQQKKKEIKPVGAPLQISAGLFATHFASTPACFTIVGAQIPQQLWPVGSMGTSCTHTL